MNKSIHLIFVFLIGLMPIATVFCQYESTLSQHPFVDFKSDDTISKIAYDLGFNYRHSNMDSAKMYLGLAAEYALKSKNHPHYLKIKKNTCFYPKYAGRR